MTDPAPTLGEVLAREQRLTDSRVCDNPEHHALAVQVLRDSLYGIEQPDGSRIGGLVERVTERAMHLVMMPSMSDGPAIFAALREEIGETDA